jgi:hypothetical protein
MLALRDPIQTQNGKVSALAVTGALLYLPFSQRSLMLMSEGSAKKAGNI